MVKGPVFNNICWDYLDFFPIDYLGLAGIPHHYSDNPDFYSS